MLARAVVLVVGVALSACGGGSGPAQAENLQGTVHDPAGAPIAAIVLTWVADTLETTSTTSASDGTYQMGLSSRSPFGRVTAHDPGGTYPDITVSVYFDTPNRTLDITLSVTGGGP